MCGIAGRVVHPQTKIDLSELKRMSVALKHRGPDGRGEYVDERVGLTMRRLSIIDLKGGSQPLYNEDRSLVIIGNGEIYNYKKIRDELLQKGHMLRSASDIEVVVHLYEDEGLSGLKKLRGMFALALYDVKAGKVMLIRDRLGEKPLYWAMTKKGLVFSSEMKSILQAKDISRELNLPAVDKYFHYYYVPEPETMFKNVHKLQPGSILSIKLEKMLPRIMQFWDPEKIKPKTVADPTAAIKKGLEESCELTLTADVGIGISLSGGLDSGSIMAMVAPKYKKQLIAFCVGYEGGTATDERLMAKKLAKSMGVKFVEKEIKIKEIVRHFPRLVFDMDDPIADIAGHAIFSVSQLAKKNNISVLLGGIGGDELFWGYPWTSRMVKNNLRHKQRKNFRFYEENFGFKMAEWFISRFYTSTFRHLARDKRGLNSYNKNIGELSYARKAMELIRDKWLMSDVIPLGDRLSMAASVELRAPFLDYKLTQTVLRHKKTVLAYNLEPKYWLKKALYGILPAEVINRPKRGFTPPVKSWLREIIDAYVWVLEDGFVVNENILDRNKIKWLTKIWKVMPIFWYQYYQLIMLDIWGRIYCYNQDWSSVKPKAAIVSI